MTLCKLQENGITDQVLKHSETVLNMKNENPIYLHFLQTKIKKDSLEAIDHIQNICELKLNQLKPLSFSESYLLYLEPNVMLDVVDEYVHHVTLKTSDETIIYELLNLIIQCCPGLGDALFLLAKIQFFKGDLTNSLNNLDKLLNKRNYSNSEAYLLIAQIQVQLGLYDSSAQNLEVNIMEILIFLIVNYIEFSDMCESKLQNTRKSHILLCFGFNREKFGELPRCNQFSLNSFKFNWHEIK